MVQPGGRACGVARVDRAARRSDYCVKMCAALIWGVAGEGCAKLGWPARIRGRFAKDVASNDFRVAVRDYRSGHGLG